MTTVQTHPNKQQKRELGRWGTILRLREAGLTIQELALKYDVTKIQIYDLLQRARRARDLGWLDGTGAKG